MARAIGIRAISGSLIGSVATINILLRLIKTAQPIQPLGDTLRGSFQVSELDPLPSPGYRITYPT